MSEINNTDSAFKLNLQSGQGLQRTSLKSNETSQPTEEVKSTSTLTDSLLKPNLNINAPAYKPRTFTSLIPNISSTTTPTSLPNSVTIQENMNLGGGAKNNSSYQSQYNLNGNDHTGTNQNFSSLMLNQLKSTLSTSIQNNQLTGGSKPLNNNSVTGSVFTSLSTNATSFIPTTTPLKSINGNILI